MPRRVTLLLLIAWVFAPSLAPAEEPPEVKLVEGYQAPLIAAEAAYNAMQQKLDQRISCDFDETPLSEALIYLSEKSGVTSRIDPRSLGETGFAAYSPVTISLKEVRLRTALRLLLGPLQLVYCIDGDRLLILNEGNLELRQRIVYYPCADLLYGPQGEGPEFDSLRRVITNSVDQESWEDLGGPGTISLQCNGLLIAQSEANHTKLAGLLAAIRQAKALQSDNYDPASIGVGVDPALRKQLHDALQTPMQNVRFEITSLIDAMQFLSDHCKVQIVLNSAALEEQGIKMDAPITDRWQAATAEVILQDVLDMLELDYRFRDAVLEVSTPQDLNWDMELKVYPVRDLLAGERVVDFENEYLRRYQGSEYAAINRLICKFPVLIDSVTSKVEPESWGELGGPGEIQPLWFADALVVAQTPANHAKIERLLAKVRRDRPLAPTRDADHPEVGAEPIVAAYKVEINGGEAALQVFAGSLQADIEPDSWDGETSYVRVMGDRLLIRHRRDIQHRIHWWISDVLNLNPTQHAAGVVR